jgi:Protein of unknown function (DUF3892)
MTHSATVRSTSDNGDQAGLRPASFGERTVMPTSVQVRCINKTNRSRSHERIKSIGGVNGDATRWKLSEDEAIQTIKQGRYAFYVERPVGRRVTVIVASRLGQEYLKTEADGEHRDNLLALPECPV